MVGIVVVSHSRLLAEGVAELATQMTQGKANIAIAAGVDDPENQSAQMQLPLWGD